MEQPYSSEFAQRARDDSLAPNRLQEEKEKQLREASTSTLLGDPKKSKKNIKPYPEPP